MEKILKARPGHSLIELIVVISILLLIFFISYDYIKTGFVTSRFESEQEESIREARRALETVERDVRMASDSVNGIYAIALALPQELVVYTDTVQTGDNNTEKVRFFIDLSTRELKKTVAMFNQATDDYDQSAATTTVARFVNNQAEPLFVYFDNNDDLTTRIEDIRRIRFNIKVNVTPLVAPNDYYVESDITLRNLKDNL